MRPGYLAIEAVNHVVAGNLLLTVQEGPQPTFDFTGTFPTIRDLAGEGKEIDPVTCKDMPLVFSYAFADGQRRGMVLVNLHLSEPRPMKLVFPGEVHGSAARQWWIDSSSPVDNNELEHAPQVHLREKIVTDFASGAVVTVPPHSLVVLSWTAR